MAALPGNMKMHTDAIVLENPRMLSLQGVGLVAAGADDVLVETQFTAISAGTERLLWEGTMPQFPGMGYPLVPGYESVGLVIAAGDNAKLRIGETVFVPGARCYEGVRALFGGAGSHLVTDQARVSRIPEALGMDATLLALAATAYRAVMCNSSRAPDLIVGHGVLGRLIARITIATGSRAPLVWETNVARRGGATGYLVTAPEASGSTAFCAIVDASGDHEILDKAIARLSPRGEVILAGFYKERLSFAFAPAFMREAAIRISSEFKPEDVTGVLALVESGALSLAGLVTHCEPAAHAGAAYQQAFEDAACLKMVLDWRKQA